jgi:hypothetical protein
MPVVTGECFMKRTALISWVSFSVLFTIGVLLPNLVFAHCDGMDGPVVKAAQKALETGNVNLVLIWVQKKDEDEIKKAFQKTLAVRDEREALLLWLDFQDRMRISEKNILRFGRLMTGLAA